MEKCQQQWYVTSIEQCILGQTDGIPLDGDGERSEVEMGLLREMGKSVASIVQKVTKLVKMECWIHSHLPKVPFGGLYRYPSLTRHYIGKLDAYFES